MLTYHTEIKHNFYAFTPIKEQNINFHGQNGSIQCMQSFINIGLRVVIKSATLVTFHLHFEDTKFPVAITTWEPFELCPP